VETPARQFKLDFIPGQTERYCLMCNEKALASPALQEMLAILRSAEYQAAVNQLPGYKVLVAGVVTDLRDAFDGLKTKPVRK
jgi:molybdate-binding protein